MLESILQLDREILLYINGLEIPFLDFMAPILSASWSGIPFYLLILCLLYKIYPIKRFAIIVVAVVAAFGLSDYLSVHLFKEVFCRYRPCHDPLIMDSVRLLESKGGLYGFISSHASNLFAIATTATYFIKKRWFSITIFSFATLVSLSRIYVGKHFLTDITCGALFGFIIGIIVALITKKILTNLK